MLSGSQFHKVISIISATKTAWFDMMPFGVTLYNPITSSISYLIIPLGVFVHTVIYID